MLLFEFVLGFFVDVVCESVGGVGDGVVNYVSNRIYSGDGATKGFVFICCVSLFFCYGELIFEFFVFLY